MKTPKALIALLLPLTLSICTTTTSFAQNKSAKKSAANAQSGQTNGNYNLLPAFPNLKFERPVELQSPTDGTNRIFVLEQKGRVRVFDNKSDVPSAGTFLDLTDRVKSGGAGGELGLLGLAFHPDFKNNGTFYLYYTRNAPHLESAVSRFQVSKTNPNVADPNSEEVILTFSQPYDNHNGGKIAFGNDGYLYIATGDGGTIKGDPHRNGQSKYTLLGKILRIDVNKTASNWKYAIPDDNPFKGNKQNYREEIYAYGMRNPWRFSFDKPTGLLWAADVGQEKYEEIDIIKNGGNYGWRLMEGDQPYKPINNDSTVVEAPIFTYQHGGDTGISITGGYVSRDKTFPELDGKYIYGDYGTGYIWALTYDGNKVVSNEKLTQLQDRALSSFGEDSQGRIYALALATGKIYKLGPAKTTSARK
ncbi:PQQ-dependent sugar dehydrogenase [Adhaeribacter aquaticus]|uniref:PQQ-dependent sugar dehydrogenase n=1 Tax=Adhaeribacter aquaticus TaxID=299567 RepID=UPI0004068E30|nr:PQQ-dependent sugar dehydrogenase [Adhaeribacter aquaticus]